MIKRQGRLNISDSLGDQWSLEILRGMGVSIAQIFKRKYEANLEIPGGGRVQTKEPSLGEVWIFFGTTPCGTKPVLQKNLTH